ncbi:MAG: hypothetical protein ACRDNE_15820, partial [Gaiellaceae bacterium]
GHWDETLQHAEAVVAAADAGSGPMQVVDARILRARIRLARGDVGGALDDSASAAALAREARDPQVAFPALATYAHALVSAGQAEEADSVATELLESWAASGATLAGPWLPELAAVLAVLGRETDLAEAATRAPTPTRWLEAATAQAAGDSGRAAGIYAEIGSLPDEAYARLRAAENLVDAGRRGEAEAQLMLALDFFRAVDAAGYLRESEALLATT